MLPRGGNISLTDQDLMDIIASVRQLRAPADKDAERDEKPQHEVTISEQFYLGQMPVTVVP